MAIGTVHAWEISVMKITVCQLPNGRETFAADWQRLVEHVRAEGSALALLPEMPFYPWFPTPKQFNARTWRDAVAAHDTWERRLSELTPAIALGTRPVDFGNLRYSTGFMWNEAEGIAETIHVKSCLSSEEGAWETTWYEKAVPDFECVTAGAVRVGMLIGLELWIPDQAKLYGEDGAQVIAVPRVDRAAQADIETITNEWLAGGRAAAAAAGAYCISSSRGGHGNLMGGAGWIVAPDGETLAMTSADQQFVTVDVDLSAVGKHPRAVAPLGMPSNAPARNAPPLSMEARFRR
jgi:predicted amidohydrolase